MGEEGGREEERKGEKQDDSELKTPETEQRSQDNVTARKTENDHHADHHAP
jgi:hypothetical protein